MEFKESNYFEIVWQPLVYTHLPDIQSNTNLGAAVKSSADVIKDPHQSLHTTLRKGGYMAGCDLINCRDTLRVERLFFPLWLVLEEGVRKICSSA